MATSQSARDPAASAAGARIANDRRGLRSPRHARYVLAFPVALAVVTASFALLTSNGVLRWTFVDAAVALLVWCAALYWGIRRSPRELAIEFLPRQQHWVQALTQGSLILYWAINTPLVFAFFPFIFAQLVFAYAVDSLLSWSRRNVYALGFGPFPVILSINLFLQFKPTWFIWQYVLVLLGFAAKEFIRWNRDGRKAHIFNPSSFPLAVFSLFLLVTQKTDVTFGNVIANTIADTPHIYLAIFLLALTVQVRFGVARVTLWAALTMYVVGLLYFAVTGTYLFYDTFIPPAVFIGMTLLVTDPSTSPRTELGKFIFGALYAIGTILLFVVLERVQAPTFYDKLLPIPALNLLVRAIDRMTRGKPLAWLAPERFGRSLTPIRRNVLITSVWAAVFIALYAVKGVGDEHPGRYLPFWHKACGAGSARACTYTATLTLVLCRNGSGWACNETGILRRRLGQPAEPDFRRACDLGFSAGCENLTRAGVAPALLASGAPTVRDLPIVLSGSKPPLRERDPAKLYAIACEQGWPVACTGPGGDGSR